MPDLKQMVRPLARKVVPTVGSIRRLVGSRKREILIRSREQSCRVKVRGVNLGAGEAWPGPLFWLALDQVDGFRFDERTVLPAEDASVSRVYSSHTFEHLFDPVASRLLHEIRRVLKPDGLLRVVIPNFEKILDIARQGDAAFLDQQGFGRPALWPSEMEFSVENWALHWFANYQNLPYEGYAKGSYAKGFFRAPPVVDRREVREMAQLHDVRGFSQWAVSKIPKDFLGFGGHVNAWSPRNFLHLLAEHGLEGHQAEFAVSESRQMASFDAKPNRRRISTYFEASVAK